MKEPCGARSCIILVPCKYVYFDRELMVLHMLPHSFVSSPSPSRSSRGTGTSNKRSFVQDVVNLGLHNPSASSTRMYAPGEGSTEYSIPGCPTSQRRTAFCLEVISLHLLGGCGGSGCGLRLETRNSWPKCSKMNEQRLFSVLIQSHQCCLYK